MESTPVRFLDTGAAPGAWNMAVDEVLYTACQRALAEGAPPEKAPFVFRLYAWSPAALTLGRGQRAARDVHLEKLKEEGVDLCRRLTGGRAVLHDRELTYSVTGPAALLGEDVRQSYCRLSEGLAAGLRKLGAPAEIAPPLVPAYAAQPSCFATTSVHEIAVGGKKVVGSAQCRGGGAILQHGSILLRSPEERLARLLRARSGTAPPTGFATGLSDVLGREVGYEEAAAAVRAGMEEALGGPFVDVPLTPEEQSRTDALAQSRYASAAWTLAR
ncbi:MAG: biotin/lipoate A/B protein ligase family protein [bacterium]|nr:biotin/lipoate A/B protein ligase family protein [bacterium]